MSHTDLIDLWNSPVRLFAQANELRESSCGRDVSFIINRNINFTNRCVGSCGFCAFRYEEGYTLAIDEIVRRAGEAVSIGATEICIQGGLAPGMVVEEYCDILEGIHREFPDLHLHAYSPMEILHMSRNSGVQVEEALKDLLGAGLGSMPGTAAEILVDDVRRKICPKKLSTGEWIDVITAAHILGIRTTSTMLYGHVEELEDRIRHLSIIREIQARTGGFTEFILLPFLPGNNPLGGAIGKGPGLLENLKMHALARVALYPLITNIQASWVKLGRENAGTALEWGANDIGGTLMEENISRSAGAKEAASISADDLRAVIEAHGRTPVQRTTLYGRVR